VHPDEFARWNVLGESCGIAHVEAGPLVRSSYHAGKQFQRALGLGGSGSERGARAIAPDGMESAGV
jgi:hypothetical protein